MIEAIQGFFEWLFSWFVDLFDAVVLFFTELPLLILQGLLSALASIINAIPVPSFFTTGLQGYLSGISADILYFLSMSGITDAFAILGAAMIFRLTRKLVTLGQW